MELEIFQAFRMAGVDEATARAAVESIDREFDKRYALHATHLFTKADGAELRALAKADVAELRLQLAETKADLIKWCVGSIFASTALYVALLKFVH